MPSPTPPRPAPVPAPGAALLALLLLLPAPGRAQAPAGVAAPARGPQALHELNGALAALAARVSPAVVEIEVTGYALTGEARPEEGPVVARQHALGSGLVVDPAGYVLTNLHVVRGAQRVIVVLASPAGRAPAGADATARRRFAARLIGSDAGVDLALLKIEASGLSHLPLDPSVRVRQGELVFAIGSPQGLASTVTMGVVGSSGRQVDAAPPLAYIQTDAPINPGNSGGPLVDVDGRVVGINTFIFSQSGGSQGLGFAIPVGVARAVADSLRVHGRVRRIDSGVGTQSITPALAAGLGLPRDWGVVVADVTLDGAAAKAGVRVGDVVDTFDGMPVESLASITSAVYLHPPGTPVRLGLLRGAGRVAIEVDAPEAKRPTDQLLDLADPEHGLVRRLGIVGVEVTAKLAGIIPPLRVGTGVVVAARTLDSTTVDSGLQAGDVIHAVNRTEIESLERLREVMRTIAPRAPVAIQVERQGRLAYLSFEME